MIKHNSLCSRLAVVTVTYKPDLALISAQLDQLPSEARLYVVDNASPLSLLVTLRNMVSERPNSQLIELKENLGLAAAINRGANEAMLNSGADFLLVLDQDTEPGFSGIQQLVAEYQLLMCNEKPICIGASMVDVSTGLNHGFHRIRWGLWLRVHPKAASRQPINCDSLNGSGSLCGLEDFLSIGGLDETLFIDHVDTEWSFRVKDAGWSLYGIPHVRFLHRMGEHSFRFWFFGWHVWPYRSPERHYFLYRNAVRLMKRPYVPRVWKAWAFVKLCITATVHTVFDSARSAQLRAMLRGCGHGFYE